jgi:general secretion pathway protein A
MDEHQSHLAVFGLREQPFAPTADPAYFYAMSRHKECLFRLWSSIDERCGIAVVLGSYGTGKTTLLRKLLTGMAAHRDRYAVAVIGSPVPSWTSFALLESIVAQFGLPRPAKSFVTYMEILNRYLLKYRDRINTLIIDDAQNINKRGQLELLRLVQNLETNQHKLLNLVLFAQVEWVQVLHAAPNFEQRINMTFSLDPIGLDETREFILFRLRQAALDPDRIDLFDEGAIHVIHAYSEGNPRVIVTLCRNTLLLAAQVGADRVGAEIVLHTIEKTTVPDAEKRARAYQAARAYRLSAGVPAIVETPNENFMRLPTTREQRASQMLLKVATKAKTTPGL